MKLGSWTENVKYYKELTGINFNNNGDEVNLICNDTRKSLILFLASMCIVFSEIVQIAYYYLSETSGLSNIYSLLLVAAFYLFYRQGFLQKEANQSLKLFKN